ncbi:MAG: hypothetical protein JRN09_03720 [Nitrososphaerota archaeon]|nr:hypothetical protein [Nitrososphaerota archaeon]
MRRALVSLPDGVWEIIDKELKGKLGDGDSEVIRNIVISHLMEKGYLLPPKAGGLGPVTEGVAGELDMHDTMINSLVELLEEKGELTYTDWERRIKRNLAKEKTRKKE